MPPSEGSALDVITIGRSSVDLYGQQIGSRLEDIVSFAKSVGITADLTERGLGLRSGRYAMVVEDGVVKTLNVEDAPGKADISGAENLLKGL